MSLRVHSVVLAALVALLVATWTWQSEEQRKLQPEVVVYEELGRALPIYLPKNAVPEQREAALLIQRTLAKAAGRHPSAFPVRLASAGFAKPGIYLGRAAVSQPGPPVFADQHQVSVRDRAVMLESHPVSAAVAGAAWFLEQAVEARWFMPGPLGESIPRKPRLSLRRETWQPSGGQPSFFHRNLGVGGGEAQSAWWRNNRLYAPLRHGHAMNELFPLDVVKKHPELQPLVNGELRPPRKPGDQGWQPNLAKPVAVDLAVSAVKEHFAKNPREVSVAIGLNDTINFDQSAETVALVEPKRWFRQKPDYSDFYFRFVNAVAGQLPGKYLGAYAYDWTEQVPRMPVERNVIPWLTSDKAQWFDRGFAEEDKDLIRRWLTAGPEIVGVYDYYYGATFLVPRPTLYAVRESIPFISRAGVRAFYAEATPNWGLDGPKAWLAAQLLWDARLDPDKLLDTYYREFWQEAAGPMRRFFEICERQWLNQPGGPYWLKYFKDEHQTLLFPPEVRLALGRELTAAAAAAQGKVVRDRVAFAQAAWSVAHQFCKYVEARDELARTLLDPRPDPMALDAQARAHRQNRESFLRTHMETHRHHPLAVQSEVLPTYVRFDPDAKLQHRARSGSSEILIDRELRSIDVRPPRDFTTLFWVLNPIWHGNGEPFESRTIELPATAEGRAVRFAGCKNDCLGQWRPVTPGQRYGASVRVKAKVSPGNSTFLILNFTDANGLTAGTGYSDRLPLGDWSQGVELFVTAVAPFGATQVGMGVYVLNQVNDDYAEFSGFSLREIED